MAVEYAGSAGSMLGHRERIRLFHAMPCFDILFSGSQWRTLCIRLPVCPSVHLQVRFGRAKRLSRERFHAADFLESDFRERCG
jgi:hypothetical protein